MAHSTLTGGLSQPDSQRTSSAVRRPSQCSLGGGGGAASGAGGGGRRAEGEFGAPGRAHGTQTRFRGPAGTSDGARPGKRAPVGVLAAEVGARGGREAGVPPRELAHHRRVPRLERPAQQHALRVARHVEPAAAGGAGLRRGQGVAGLAVLRRCPRLARARLRPRARAHPMRAHKRRHTQKAFTHATAPSPAAYPPLPGPRTAAAPPTSARAPCWCGTPSAAPAQSP
jgi:hypothetical protein